MSGDRRALGDRRGAAGGSVQPGGPGGWYGRLASWADGLGFRPSRALGDEMLRAAAGGYRGAVRGNSSPSWDFNRAWVSGMARDLNYLILWRVPLCIFMLALCLPLSPRCYLCWPPLQDKAEFTIPLCKQVDVNLPCFVKKFILIQHSHKRRALLLELGMYI